MDVGDASEDGGMDCCSHLQPVCTGGMERPNLLRKSGLSYPHAGVPTVLLTIRHNQLVAASLSFFIGRTLTFTVAGLAANVVS
jgi:hypothetical protein